MLLLPSLLLFCQTPPSAQEPAAAPAAKAAESPEVAAIRAAAKKLAAAPNYTFRQVSTDDGGGFGPGGDSGPQTSELVAHVQKDKPLHLQQGEMEAWRQEGVLIHRTGSGAWERFDLAAGRRGGQRQFRVEGEDGWRAMRARLQMTTAPVLHEMFANLEAGIATVAKSEENGASVYTGTLTGEGALRLSGPIMTGGRGGRGGDGGGNRPPMESSGTFRVLLAADGTLQSAMFDVTTKGSFGERDFERKRRLELSLSSVGSTAMEVPAEVTAKFAEGPPPPPDEEF